MFIHEHQIRNIALSLLALCVFVYYRQHICCSQPCFILEDFQILTVTELVQCFQRTFCILIVFMWIYSHMFSLHLENTPCGHRRFVFADQTKSSRTTYSSSNRKIFWHCLYWFGSWSNKCIYVCVIFHVQSSTTVLGEVIYINAFAFIRSVFMYIVGTEYICVWVMLRVRCREGKSECWVLVDVVCLWNCHAA